MLTAPCREWLSMKVQIADEIVDKHKRNGEPDAEILLCCVIGALAATMWPRDYIDKFRFIQFLVEFAPKSLDVQKISIYHLIEKLASDAATTQALINSFFTSREDYDGKVFLDGESLPISLMQRIIHDASQVDQRESTIASLLPNIQLRTLRKSSYAAIIYSDLRNSLVHLYRIKEPLASHGMSNRSDIPSYANMSYLPDEEEARRVAATHNLSIDEVRASLAVNQRRLFFPYGYVRRLLIETAEAAFDYWDTVDSWERPLPNETDRWINGGKIA